jgi:hypothetical protein
MLKLAQSPHGAGGGTVAEYRAYQIGPDGHIVGFEPIVCTDDDEATQRAQRLVDDHSIELWTGERLVTRLERKSN